MKPVLLALDTTHESGSIALNRGDEVLEEVAVTAPDGFAHVVYGHLRTLLNRHDVSLAEIDCFASASGPGSFTGVRVGLTCMKGLAEACGKPAIAVSNMEALASFGSAPLRAAVMDARRGEIYGAVYDAQGRLVAPETVMSFRAWIETIPNGDVEFIAPDFSLFCEAFAGSRFESARRMVAPRALAAAVGRIARTRLLRGDAPDPASLDANYVRRSDAELFWKE